MEICTKEVESRQAAPPAVAVKPNTGAADPLAISMPKALTDQREIEQGK